MSDGRLDRLRIVFCVVSVFALQACSRQPDFYPRPMWDGQRYDVAVPLDDLRAIGWNCQAEQFAIDDYDGACGTRVDLEEGPPFTVFGIPRTASTVFLKQGALKGINIGIHATSALTLAAHLSNEFGTPLRYKDRLGCRLVWTRGQTHYRLDIYDQISDGYTNLYIEVGGPPPSGIKESPLARFWGSLRGTPCSNAS